ncbi:hypothetical protein [Kaistia terrae]|uniref:Uncharacterized protein n=1 Tax=Kaistia terrae TaxID=537017 RepID=A0ABW0Q2I7_9HYPH
MKLITSLYRGAAILGLLLTASVPVSALPLPPGLAPNVSSRLADDIVPVANGCGPQRYRGPGGLCHPFGWPPGGDGYLGPYGRGFGWNGCPPGYWRGPWGHCRNTPYHGRLPGGGWK